MLRIALMSLFLLLGTTGVKANEPARDTLWLTTTMRAAPGELEGLIGDLQNLAAKGYYAKAGRVAPLIMRHSQGDQWDLMLLEPIGSYSAFFCRATPRGGNQRQR